MLLLLLVVAALFLMWLALAPRTGGRALQTRQALEARIPFPKKPASSESFNALLAQAASAPQTLTGAWGTDLPEMQNWFQGLTNQERKQFETRVLDACKKAGVNADWLYKHSAKGEMENAVRETVTLQALALWRARALEPFALFEAYRAKPNTRQHKALAQRVFAQLAETRTLALSPDMMLGSEKKRAAYVKQTIEQAWDENPDALMAIFKQAADDVKQPKAKTRAKASPEPQPAQTVPSGLVEVNA